MEGCLRTKNDIHQPINSPSPNAPVYFPHPCDIVFRAFTRRHDGASSPPPRTWSSLPLHLLLIRRAAKPKRGSAMATRRRCAYRDASLSCRAPEATVGEADFSNLLARALQQSGVRIQVVAELETAAPPLAGHPNRSAKTPSSPGILCRNKDAPS